MTRTRQHRGLVVLLGLACFVVVVAGFKVAGEIIVPMMTALFLSLLCLPPIKRLERHRVPSALAIAIVVAAASLIVVLVLSVMGSSITGFQSQLPIYEERLNELVGGAVLWLAERGVDLEPDELVDSIDSGAIMRLVGNTASSLVGALSNLLLVVLMMVFMLGEARALSPKLRQAMGRPDADLSEFSTAVDRVHKYLAIKAWVSLATGILVGALCAGLGVDFPLLWALVAFLFNFVPNIGSIIAAIPAILLALVQLGPGHALLLAVGYFAINMLIGNVIEPRMMGRKLGLSTLVVFLSMLFWGWVWGPVGMLLSVPLTVVVKILLEHSDDLRWIAVLLGPDADVAMGRAQK